MNTWEAIDGKSKVGASKEHLQFDLELVWDIFRHPEDVVMMLGRSWFYRVGRNESSPRTGDEKCVKHGVLALIANNLLCD